jgi:adenylate cyclase
MQKSEKRILVVDDDEAIRTLLFTILRRRGFAVDTAKDGADALERLGRCTYVLMLLDLMMPRVNGWQILDHLHTWEAATRPVVILLTAGTDPREIDPDLVVGSIRKPFDIELLVDTVVACAAALAPRSQRSGCPSAESA